MQNNKVYSGSVKYFIDEKNGVVVCTIYNCRHSVLDYVSSYPVRLNHLMARNLTLMPDSFTGKAFCHPDDKDLFDPEVGKRLAYVRAKAKFLKSFNKRVTSYYRECLQWLDTFVGEELDYYMTVRKSLQNEKTKLSSELHIPKEEVFHGEI